MKLKSRLSIGDVYGKVATKENLRAMMDGAELDIVQVIGYATRVVVKEDGKFGISYKIMGDFKMTNLKTGEAHYGSTLYLPVVGTDAIGAQLADKNVTSCQFAFKITARYDETSPVLYVYDFEPMLPVGLDSPIALLEALLADNADGEVIDEVENSVVAVENSVVAVENSVVAVENSAVAVAESALTSETAVAKATGKAKTKVAVKV